jgi:hypothetical protein
MTATTNSILTLSLNVNSVQIILNALSELPYKVAAETIQIVQTQAQKQINELNDPKKELDETIQSNQTNEDEFAIKSVIDH